jgi:hypothetical protein
VELRSWSGREVVFEEWVGHGNGVWSLDRGEGLGRGGAPLKFFYRYSWVRVCVLLGVFDGTVRCATICHMLF